VDCCIDAPSLFRVSLDLGHGISTPTCYQHLLNRLSGPPHGSLHRFPGCLCPAAQSSMSRSHRLGGSEEPNGDCAMPTSFLGWRKGCLLSPFRRGCLSSATRDCIDRLGRLCFLDALWRGMFDIILTVIAATHREDHYGSLL